MKLYKDMFNFQTCKGAKWLHLSKQCFLTFLLSIITCFCIKNITLMILQPCSKLKRIKGPVGYICIHKDTQNHLILWVLYVESDVDSGLFGRSKQAGTISTLGRLAWLGESQETGLHVREPCHCPPFLILFSVTEVSHAWLRSHMVSKGDDSGSVCPPTGTLYD